MLVVSNSFLLPSILPKVIIDEIENEKVAEESMLAIAVLVSNIVIGAAKSWQKRELKKLDPNPGDGGCQMRGFLLYLFCLDPSVGSEMENLKGRFEKIRELTNRRNAEVAQKKWPSQRSALFFKELFGVVTLSKKVEFILQCYLLAITRAPFQRLENGIVLTKTEVSLLSKLSNKISIVTTERRRKIVEWAQASLSANSVDWIRTEAKKLTCLTPLVKERVLLMLSPEKSRLFTPEVQYEPKTFGCLFYEYQAILYRLREERAIVCFKSIVPPKEKPFWILLQPQQVGGEFIPLLEKVELDLPVVVFEGVVNGQYDQSSFAKKITEIGFTELILTTAAIEAPYDRSSDLNDLKNEEAFSEITRYRLFAEKINCQKGAANPLLILDHVYCSVLKAEIGRQV